MSILVFSTLTLLAGLAAIASILGTQFFFSRQRRRRFQQLELVPNILMTRYPLLFVGRSRSIFRVAGDFLELPIYLQEHGFRVEEVEISNAASRVSGRPSYLASALARVLSTSKEPVHLIVGEALSHAAYDLAMEGHPNLATLTLLGRTPTRDRRIELRPSKNPVFEKPELRPSMIASSFRTEEIALSHMVSLAEHDLR